MTESYSVLVQNQISQKASPVGLPLVTQKMVLNIDGGTLTDSGRCHVTGQMLVY